MERISRFFSHGLCTEKQNILLQHMHEKKFFILTNKCGNKLSHENEQNPKIFFPHVLKKDVLLLCA